MNILQKRLLENNPKLMEMTIHNYSACLKKIFNGTAKQGDTITVDYFVKNYKNIVDFIEKRINVKSKKTHYAPLITLLKDINTSNGVQAVNAYKSAMYSHIDDYNLKQKQQKKTDSQEANWIEWNDVIKQYHKLWKEFSSIFQKPTPLSLDDHRNLQRLVALACFTLIPPRRNLDWIAFKIKDIDESKDNYLDMKKKELVFNQYKLSTRKGPQVIKCPPNLFNILKQYMKIQKEMGIDWLFSTCYKNGECKKMTGQNFSYLIQSCFGTYSGVNINILRHSFITYLYQDTPSLLAKEEVARQMGHSSNQAELYRKID